MGLISGVGNRFSALDINRTCGVISDFHSGAAQDLSFPDFGKKQIIWVKKEIWDTKKGNSGGFEVSFIVHC